MQSLGESNLHSYWTVATLDVDWRNRLLRSLEADERDRKPRPLTKFSRNAWSHDMSHVSMTWPSQLLRDNFLGYTILYAYCQQVRAVPVSPVLCQCPSLHLSPPGRCDFSIGGSSSTTTTSNWKGPRWVLWIWVAKAELFGAPWSLNFGRNTY